MVGGWAKPDGKEDKLVQVILKTISTSAAAKAFRG